MFNVRFRTGNNTVEHFFHHFKVHSNWTNVTERETNIRFVEDSLHIHVHLHNIEYEYNDYKYLMMTQKQRNIIGLNYLAHYAVSPSDRISLDDSPQVGGSEKKLIVT